jgi:hypothetical protein
MLCQTFPNFHKGMLQRTEIFSIVAFFGILCVLTVRILYVLPGLPRLPQEGRFGMYKPCHTHLLTVQTSYVCKKPCRTHLLTIRTLYVCQAFPEFRKGMLRMLARARINLHLDRVAYNVKLYMASR